MTIKHIMELFVLDGADFVTEAYRNLICREPDEHGLAYYLGRLSLGYGKAAVIVQLAQSPECRLHDEINGLKKFITDERRALHWFWGSLGSRRRVEKTLQSSLNALAKIDHNLVSLHSAMLTNTKQLSELTQQVAESEAFVFSKELANHDQRPSSQNVRVTSNSFADLPNWVNLDALDKVRELIGSGTPIV